MEGPVTGFSGKGEDNCLRGRCSVVVLRRFRAAYCLPHQGDV
jgi:hypothetical protein